MSHLIPLKVWSTDDVLYNYLCQTFNDQVGEDFLDALSDVRYDFLDVAAGVWPDDNATLAAMQKWQAHYTKAIIPLLFHAVKQHPTQEENYVWQVTYMEHI